MTYEDFIVEIWAAVNNYPKTWRQGQKVFNAVEELYGNVAREVQFQDDVDCFYNDDCISEFIQKVWCRLNNRE